MKSFVRAIVAAVILLLPFVALYHCRWRRQFPPRSSGRFIQRTGRGLRPGAAIGDGQLRRPLYW